MPHPNSHNVSQMWKRHTVSYNEEFYEMRYIWIPIISCWEGRGSFIMMHQMMEKHGRLNQFGKENNELRVLPMKSGGEGREQCNDVV